MKNFIKINKHKLTEKFKFKSKNEKSNKPSSPLLIKNDDSSNEKILFPFSKCAVSEISEQNKLILFQRALILLGEQIFSGTYVSRRREAQKTFHEVLKDVDIEKLHKMSRKQKFISYARIKIGVRRLIYEKNIRQLLHEGKSDDVFIILKESRKL